MRVRRMTCEDIAAGMGLVRAAGWNQTEADWKRFLEIGPAGCFVAEAEGEVCGTAATIVYGNQLAWIGMVLVSPSQRGRGIGTELLKLALGYLDSQGPLTIKLDATPQGRPIYERLGFEPECEIERWTLSARQRFADRVQHDPGIGDRPSWLGTGAKHQESARFFPKAGDESSRKIAGAGADPSSQVCVPWTDTAVPRDPPAEYSGCSDLNCLLAMDQAVFGANRGGLLRSLHRDAPELTAVIWDCARVAGCTLGRHGLHADQLGPWMAENEHVARTLLECFLSHSRRERVVADCLKSNPFASELLRSEGFEFSRPLTRMVRGPNGNSGRPEPELLCAILGPEFG